MTNSEIRNFESLILRSEFLSHSFWDQNFWVTHFEIRNFELLILRSEFFSYSFETRIFEWLKILRPEFLSDSFWDQNFWVTHFERPEFWVTHFETRIFEWLIQRPEFLSDSRIFSFFTAYKAINVKKSIKIRVSYAPWRQKLKNSVQRLV